MKLQDPRPWIEQVDQERYHRILGRELDVHPPSVSWSVPTPIEHKALSVASMPNYEPKSSIVRGRIHRFGDHVDTDAIIPGEFCHLTDLDDLGQHCFHHVAPGFRDRVLAGQNIIVAGEGWGSGSSREQAVWALKGAESPWSSRRALRSFTSETWNEAVPISSSRMLIFMKQRRTMGHSWWMWPPG